MTRSEDTQHRGILVKIAHRVMLEKGLLPDFSPEALAELDVIRSPAVAENSRIRDLRDRPWVSIDNDDSRDLDQLTVAEELPGGMVKVFAAVADVDAVVGNGSALDSHARHNTTSIYTAAMIFPMLPEKLSTDLTSLNYREDRLAVVIEMDIDRDGILSSSQVYRALVRNHSQLAYNAVAAWLDGDGPLPEGIAEAGLDENLRMQDGVARKMKAFRHAHGALSLETIETKPVFHEDELSELEVERKNRAKDIIEDFMVAANGVTARHLSTNNFPSLRRVVRTPKRWERIVDIALEHGARLPELPDPKALEQFLVTAKEADPVHFPDLSLCIIKLLGAGEYVVEFPGEAAPGHFGLAVKDYTHSTAPNRRYPDLITQRLLKASLSGAPVPYSNDELVELAEHCTRQEDVVNKVERRVRKSAEALLLKTRVGEQFEAIVTGALPKGTWVRLLHPPVEGKLVRGFEGVDIGHRLRVQLIRTDVDRGFIDFKRVRH